MKTIQLNRSNVACSGLMTAGMVLLAVMICSPVLAQPPGRGGPDGPGRGGPDRGGPPRGGPGQFQRGGGGMGLGMLLRIPEVREELEVSIAQEKAVREKGRELMEEMRNQYGDQMGGRRGGGRGRGQGRGQGRPARDAEQGDNAPNPRDDMRKKVEAALGEVLDSSQLDRLKQIHVQHMLRMGGPRSFMSGPLADELAITDEQRDTLREKGKAVMEQMREMQREERTAAHKEMQESMLSVLTSEQRGKLEQLKGEPFEMPEIRGGRGGRGGDFRGGPGGPGRPEGGPPRGGRGQGRGQGRPAPDA